MDFVEKLCKREHEQIYLFIAKCGQLWIKSVQLIFCKDNANSNKIFRTCLKLFFQVYLYIDINLSYGWRIVVIVLK